MSTRKLPSYVPIMFYLHSWIQVPPPKLRLVGLGSYHRAFNFTVAQNYHKYVLLSFFIGVKMVPVPADFPERPLLCSPKDAPIMTQSGAEVAPSSSPSPCCTVGHRESHTKNTTMKRRLQIPKTLRPHSCTVLSQRHQYTQRKDAPPLW